MLNNLSRVIQLANDRFTSYKVKSNTKDHNLKSKIKRKPAKGEKGRKKISEKVIMENELNFLLQTKHG